MTFHEWWMNQHGIMLYENEFRKCWDAAFARGAEEGIRTSKFVTDFTHSNLMRVIREVHSQHADDLCWMDIDRIFAAALLPVPDRRVGDKAAMKMNCDRFIDLMCAGGTWQSYAELETERDRLRAERDALKTQLAAIQQAADLTPTPGGWMIGKPGETA